MFYSHKLTRTLNELIEDQLSLDPSEQLNLFQELALMRESASEAVGLYAAAHEAAAQGKDPEGNLRMAAAQLMADHLKNVRDMCQAATAVEATRRDRLDGYALKTVIAQISRIAFECFGDTPEARRFEVMLREKIKVPGTQEQAGESPDEVVRKMMERTLGSPE